MNTAKANFWCLQLLEYENQSEGVTHKQRTELQGLIELSRSSLTIENLLSRHDPSQSPLSNQDWLNTLSPLRNLLRNHISNGLIEALLSQDQSMFFDQGYRVTHEALRTQLLLAYCYSPQFQAEIGLLVAEAIGQQNRLSAKQAPQVFKRLSQQDLELWKSALLDSIEVPATRLISLGFAEREIQLINQLRKQHLEKIKEVSRYSLLDAFKDYLILWQHLILHPEYRYCQANRERSHKERFKRLCLYKEKLLQYYPNLQPVKLRLRVRSQSSKNEKTRPVDQPLESVKTAWKAFNLKLKQPSTYKTRPRLQGYVGYVMRWDDLPEPSVDAVFFFDATQAPYFKPPERAKQLIQGWQAELPSSIRLQADSSSKFKIQQDQFVVPILLHKQLHNSQDIQIDRAPTSDPWTLLFYYWSYKDAFLPAQQQARRVNQGSVPKQTHQQPNTARDLPTSNQVLQAAEASFNRLEQALKKMTQRPLLQKSSLVIPNELKQLPLFQQQKVIQSLEQQICYRILISQIETKWGGVTKEVRTILAGSSTETLKIWLKELVHASDPEELSGWEGSSTLVE